MKKYLITFLLSIGLTTAYCQTKSQITLQDLITLYSSRDANGVEKFTASKDYHYHHVKQVDSKSVSIFYKAKNLDEFLDILLENDEITCVGYLTSNKERYLDIVDKIKKSGFTYKETFSQNGNQMTSYANKKYGYGAIFGPQAKILGKEGKYIYLVSIANLN